VGVGGKRRRRAAKRGPVDGSDQAWTSSRACAMGFKKWMRK